MQKELENAGKSHRKTFLQLLLNITGDYTIMKKSFQS
jgi:hypothetical protein